MEMQTIEVTVNNNNERMHVPSYQIYERVFGNLNRTCPNVVDAAHPVGRSDETTWGPSKHLYLNRVLRYQEPTALMPNRNVGLSRMQPSTGDLEIQYIVDECTMSTSTVHVMLANGRPALTEVSEFSR